MPRWSHHRPLGLPGRTRGIDHIDQVVGAGEAGRVVLALSGERVLGVEAEQAGRRGGKLPGQALVGQYDRHGGVSQQEGQPLGGGIRVERDVRRQP